MDLVELMELRPGITAVIGGGGKTTFLRTAGELLARDHTVLLCTTTKMYPFPDIPFAGTADELDRLQKMHRLICAGQLIPDLGKIRAPQLPMDELAERFEYILVEADGAARRPMKAHADHEPPIPPERNQVIELVGASGFGRPISEAAHRPGIYARLADVPESAVITPEIAAEVLLAEGLHHRVFINQVESMERAEWARRMAIRLDCQVAAGALQKGVWFQCV